MIKLLFLALLAQLALVSALSFFKVDYAPNSPFMTDATGAYDQSEESASVTRAQYYTQPYNMLHGEYPSYQIRIRTYGTSATTGLYIWGNFNLTSATCMIANYSSPRTGKVYQPTLMPSSIRDGGYTCSLYSPGPYGGPGYIYFSSIPQNTYTIVIINSTSMIPCLQPEGAYGNITFNARSDQAPSGYPTSQISTYVIHNNTGNCICPPGTFQTDNPLGCSATDAAFWLNSSYYGWNCNDPHGNDNPYFYFGFYYRMRLGQFYYTGLNATINQVPYTRAGVRSPFAVLSGYNTFYLPGPMYDTFISNPTTGYYNALRTNSTAGYPQYTNMNFNIFFNTSHDCTLNNWVPGVSYPYPATMHAFAPAYNGWLNGTAGLSSQNLVVMYFAGCVNDCSKKRGLNNIIRSTPLTACAATVDVQQTMIGSRRENGVEKSRWSVTVSTTTEPMHDLELTIRPPTQDGHISDFVGVSEVYKGLFRVDDSRFLDGHIAPNTQLREIEYVIEGSEPADIHVKKAVCDKKCSSGAFLRLASHSEDNKHDEVFYDYLLHVTNHGSDRTDTVTFEITVSDPRQQVDLLDPRGSTKVVNGLTTKFTIVLRDHSMPGQVSYISIVVMDAYSNMANYVDPVVSGLTTRCR